MGDADDLGKRLLAAIDRVRVGQGRVTMPFVACAATPAYGLLVAKTISAKDKEELRKSTGGKTLVAGTCTFEDGRLVFVTETVKSGLAKNLQKTIHVSTGRKLKVRAVDAARTAVDEELEPVADADDMTAAPTAARAPIADAAAPPPAPAGPTATAAPAPAPKRGADDTPIRPTKFTYKEDEAARKRGIELRKKWEEEEKKQPSPYEDKDGDGVVDRLIDDKIERAKAFAAHGLSEASTTYDADTPETEFLADLKSGVDHYAAVFGHVGQALDYWQTHGKWVGISAQVADLANIASSLKASLGKVSAKIDRIQQVVAFAQGLEELSGSWSKFDPADPGTHKPFIDSMKRFGKKAEPFADWAKTSLVEYAIEGSEVAAKGLIVVQMLTFYVQAGVGLLEAGIAAEKAYITKKKALLDSILDGTVTRQKPPPPEPRLPPPPVMLFGWASRRQEHNAAVAGDNAALLRAIEGKRADEVAKLERLYLTTGFPATYVKNRGKLIDFIWKHGFTENTVAENTGDPAFKPRADRERVADYWAGLLTNNSDYFSKDRRRIVRSPGKDDVKNEIGRFHSARPKCPLFEEMFKGDRDRFIAEELGKAHREGR
jgi:hypothetical protein